MEELLKLLVYVVVAFFVVVSAGTVLFLLRINEGEPREEHPPIEPDSSNRRRR